MNYEERYNQAIEAAKRELHCCGSLDCDAARQIFRLFPELRESEDERISKEIIQFLLLPHPQFVGKRNYEEWISWLEKQGEQKDTVTPQWMINFLKEHRRHFGTPMDYDEKKETDGKLLAVIKWLEGNPQLEQKPAWSEEDEKKIMWLVRLISTAGYRELENDKMPCSRIELLDWLKSLKPNNWKPSEEQMEALVIAVHDAHGRSYYEKLFSIYNYLKTL